MVNGDSCFRADRYADGAEIMIGDRVSWLSGDVNKPHLGIIVAVIAANTKEACDWGMPNGGYLVLMDDLGLTGAAEADDEMSLLARGNEQDIAFAREFMHKNQVAFSHAMMGETKRRNH